METFSETATTMTDILDIDGVTKFKYFTETYPSSGFIDWGRVSDRYAGVSIMKYLNRCRATWYITWDVDAIVVWDPDSI